MEWIGDVSIVGDVYIQKAGSVKKVDIAITPTVKRTLSG
jgi:hypothetical protein